MLGTSDVTLHVLAHCQVTTPRGHGYYELTEKNNQLGLMTLNDLSTICHFPLRSTVGGDIRRPTNVLNCPSIQGKAPRDTYCLPTR